MTARFKQPESHHHCSSFTLEELRASLAIGGVRSTDFFDKLPFGPNDVTAGSETELQVAVSGSRRDVDLARTIESSNYFANIVRRAAAGDTSGKIITDLEKYLDANIEGIWENSWVRFPAKTLNSYALATLQSDLLQDRRDPSKGARSDLNKFRYSENEAEFARVPISYLLKLSLAQALGSSDNVPETIIATGRSVMDRLLNDNTSPETLSFHVVPFQPEGLGGKAIARETSKRYLLCQLLVMYANEAFSLIENGQRAMLYFSPHPPIRQKQLNDCVSDAFYRELFMSPCLSGWDNGWAKHDYMCLCHQVLSRSQLNAVAKLREAGIITRNLVVIPSVSNVSLANNGTHISLGSIRLTESLAARSPKFSCLHEKYLGDLVIKIVEHFLPLFVGTYSAAPYRIDFADFHPERVLGFLPHELDYTHLRMIWRRWKKKARLSVLGRPLTPFGIRSLDRAVSFLFRVRGDYVPDYRLMDYLVTPMSTAQSPALDGKPDNTERLKQDLADLGVFDTRMSLYSLYRLRKFGQHGFSGFEGRHYSLFHSPDKDMANAADLQRLVTALAYKYALEGRVAHAHIPDDTFTESERRQIFFGCATGIPTFYVHCETRNAFLKGIIKRTQGVRYSRRYPGFLRVYHRQYRLALLDLIATEGGDLVEMLQLAETMDDLAKRLDRPDIFSAEGKITSAVLDDLGVNSPLKVSAEEFNDAAEHYYRSELKRLHMEEALDYLRSDLREMDKCQFIEGCGWSDSILPRPGGAPAMGFLDRVRLDLLREELPADILTSLIHLVLLTVHRDARQAETMIKERRFHEEDCSSIHRAGNW